MAKTVSATLHIRDTTYHYKDCNVYQQVIYQKLDKQMDIIKEKETTYKTYITQQNYNEIQRAVGVLEFFIAKMEEYAKLKEIPHIFSGN